MKRLFYGLTLLTAALWSCDYEPDWSDGTYGPGIYITNEGAGTANGTVSFIDREFGGVVNDIYDKANDGSIGGKVQSMYFTPGIFFLVCSDKIELVDNIEFHPIGTINGFMQAQRFVVNDTIAYVTEWRNPADSGWVRSISMFTNLPVDTLKVGKGPKHMYKVGNSLFVSNSLDSTITVINTTNFTVQTTINVGDRPENMEMDQNGLLWVLCKGRTSADAGGPTPGSIVRFNPSTFVVADEIPFPASGNPNFLRAKREWDAMYYYYDNGIYLMDIDAVTLPATPLIETVGNTNALGIDPHTGFVYVADKKNGTTNGRLRWYNGASGLEVDSGDVGIVPNDFFFVQP